MIMSSVYSKLAINMSPIAPSALPLNRTTHLNMTYFLFSHSRHILHSPGRLLAAISLLTLWACGTEPNNIDTQAEVADQPIISKMSQAAVAMPDRYSAEVSARILEEGGNAVDAAVAAAFTLAVTYPEAGNIGGGGFMLLRVNGVSEFLDYREVAPAAATRDMFLNDNGEVVHNSSLSGHRASGVPGTVAGMWAAHQRHGKLEWHRLLAEPIRLAADGFEVHNSLKGSYARAVQRHKDSGNLHQHFGASLPDTLVQPDLAATLNRISKLGPDDFYKGETAKLLAAEMQRGQGLITLQDLADYSIKWRKPLIAKWRDYEVHTAPPPSSGGIALMQLLGMKDILEEQFAEAPHNSARYVHLVAEIEKRVFADRAEYLGDPEFVDVPVADLIAEKYLRKRAATIRSTSISPTPDINPGLESHDTTHFSVMDRWGNAVANTYTINFGFGNGVVVGGAGFLLNNEMDDFSIKPGVPNIFGVVGNQANEIAPRKRMLSSMTPTLLVQDAETKMVLGSPGGSTIFTSVFQTIINLIDFKMSANDAVSAARFHHQLIPKDLISMSLDLPEATQQQLRNQGYRVEPNSWGVYGDVQLINRRAGVLDAASDARYRGESRVLLGH